MTTGIGQLSICPGCGGGSASVALSDCRDLLMEVPGEWQIVRCRDCRLIFTDPRPADADLLRFYPSHYHVYDPGAPVRSSRVGAAVRSIAMAPYTWRFGAADWAPAPFGNGRFLDVGCGAGGLLLRMGALGWRCTGIDFSPTAVAAARRCAPEATIEQATLSTFKPASPFALVSLYHVLEHLPDPVTSLAHCRELLEPGGQLLVSVPNIDSFEARTFGHSWIGLDIPRHLTHFTPATLTELLQRSGFDVVRVRPAMFASSLIESALMTLPRRASRRILGSRMGRFLYFAAVLPAAISYVLGNYPVMEVLARRAK